MKEFKINEFLTVKLEGGITSLYLEGKRFQQSKFLILQAPLKDSEINNEIEHIDWKIQDQDEVFIEPESEFWAHCSNLQAWYEHKYDPLLLHSNLAFPLLKELTNSGDPLAEDVFKKEIVNRVKSGNPSIILYLLKENFLKYLEVEQLNNVFTHIILKINDWEDNQTKFDVFYIILEKITELLKENKFSALLSESSTENKSEGVGYYINPHIFKFLRLIKLCKLGIQEKLFEEYPSLELIDLIDSAIKLNPKDIELKQLKAVILCVLRKYEQAIKYIDNELKLKNLEDDREKDITTLFISAYANIGIGRFNQAVNIRSNLLRSYSENFISYLLDAFLYAYNMIYQFDPSFSKEQDFHDIMNKLIAIFIRK